MREFYSPNIYLNEVLLAQEIWEKMNCLERIDFLKEVLMYTLEEEIRQLARFSLLKQVESKAGNRSRVIIMALLKLAE